MIRRLLRGVLGLLRTNRKFLIGSCLLVTLVAVALLSPVISRAIGGGTDPTALAAFERWQMPGGRNLLGTDRYGRDVLAMVVSGTRVSLQIGAVAGIVSTVVGVIVGFVAGYKGGVIDTVLSACTSMLLVVPTLPLLIAMSAYAKEVTLFQVSLMLAIFAWPFSARTIRSQVLTLRTRPYVELARVSRMGDMEIIVKELLPNLLPFIGVGFASSALGAVFGLLGLQVIGLGPSGVIDLGFLIFTAIDTGALTLGAWPLFVVPIVILIGLFAGLNMINFGLEEMYNPRLKGA
ncbi:ABC transporter permease [Brachybacterium sp. NBEC-018]|uniref:ABC transporter permease n=1 Tax=Brachybacterium sp. NBEC-018 TaxID=2996004 RepID=UPI0021750F0F|nr:ABC transporter permease [Brachybacterium sp. NBEC-018]UVY84015.1 ABC transporter permease [Brachybacterium sp. NBEC-018]